MTAALKASSAVWLHTIVDRAAADHFRKAARRPKETLLPSEHGDDLWGDEPFTDSPAGAVELGIIVQEILDDHSAQHRQVIELHVFDGWTAAETCSTIDGMSANNVAQIASRFRAKLRERLDPDRGANPRVRSRPRRYRRSGLVGYPWSDEP